jgi:hypothetical protein
MPTYDLAWNRSRLSEAAPWQLEADLCERVLLEGHTQVRAVGRLAGILEDEIETPAHRDKFWHDARRKLGKLRRLNQRDIWQIELLLARKVRPAWTHLPATVRPGERRIRRPHRPLRQKTLRAP